jgi:hypothetical protein
VFRWGRWFHAVKLAATFGSSIAKDANAINPL